jgi:hypothetical protein
MSLHNISFVILSKRKYIDRRRLVLLAFRSKIELYYEKNLEFKKKR